MKKSLYSGWMLLIHLLVLAFIVRTKSAMLIVQGSVARMCTWSGRPPILYEIPDKERMMPPM